MSIQNPEAAQEALEELKKQTGVGEPIPAPVEGEEATAAEAVAAAEQTDPIETVPITARGETIEMEPIGVGQRLRPIRQLERAEEQGDDMAAIDAMLDMIDILVENSPPAYDERWWDRVDEDLLQSVFYQFTERSAGGGQAGN